MSQAFAVHVFNREHKGVCSCIGCKTENVMACIKCKKDFCFDHLVGGYTRTHCYRCSAELDQIRNTRARMFLEVKSLVEIFPGTDDPKVLQWFKKLEESVEED